MTQSGELAETRSSGAARRHDIVAVAVCVGVLVLALAIGHRHRVGGFGVETDFYGMYVGQAQNILAGHAYTYRHNPPGYMVLLAAASLLTGNFFVAGKIITAVATAVFGWVTYLLLKALFDSEVALAAMLLMLAALIPYSFLAAMDMLGAASIMLPLWVLLRRPTVSVRVCLLIGVLCGAAYLIRYSAIFLVMGAGFSLLFINPSREALGARSAKLAVFLGGFALTTAPWLAISWRVNGSPFASTAYLQIAAHFYDLRGDGFGTTLKLASLQFGSLLDVLLHDPVALAFRYVRDLYWYSMRLATEGIQFPAYLFAGAGSVFLAREATRRQLAFVIVSIFGFLLMALVGFYLRYYFFIFPLLFVTVAYFLFHRHVDRRLRVRLFSRVGIGWTVTLVLALLLGLRGYAHVRDTLAEEPRYLIGIGAWLRGRSSPSDIVIVRKPHLAYLAGLRSEFPLAETADEFVVKASDLGARYIVYSDYEAELWPGLESLMNPEEVPESLRLIYHHQATRTLIYEVRTDGRAGNLISR